MIIDAHTHITQDESIVSLILSMDKNKIDKIVILPIHPNTTNEFIGNTCLKYPDRLIGFSSFSPAEEGAENKILDDIKNHNLKGVKLHPRIQQVSPGDEMTIRFIKKAAALKLPIIIDCFPQVDNKFPVHATFPETIGELAHNVPDAKIIIAHAGGYKLWDAFFIARANKNIYLDFSFSPAFFKGSSLEQDLGFVLKKLGAKRCIYGSDYPDIPFIQSLKYANEMTDRIGFSDEENQYFFGKTLLSLLPEDKDGSN